MRRTPVLLLPLFLGCASADAPWDVPEGEEISFKRTYRECQLLTRNAEGEPGPIPFDDCMERRGWKRMGPFKRAWKRVSR